MHHKHLARNTQELRNLNPIGQTPLVGCTEDDSFNDVLWLGSLNVTHSQLIYTCIKLYTAAELQARGANCRPTFD